MTRTGATTGPTTSAQLTAAAVRARRVTEARAPTEASVDAGAGVVEVPVARLMRRAARAVTMRPASPHSNNNSRESREGGSSASSSSSGVEARKSAQATAVLVPRAAGRIAPRSF